VTSTCHRFVSIVVAVPILLVTSLYASAATDLYTGLTLIDPEKESRIENAYILVKDGKIVMTGSGSVSGSLKADRVHDHSGRFAMPGFIDAHAHITTGPLKVELRSGKPEITFVNDDNVSRHYGRIALAFGVTTIRNPGGSPTANARYDAMIADGSWVGPEASHAGAVIQPPPFAGDSFAYPRTEAEWQTEANRQSALGMKYLKLYTDLSEEELATGIRVAHEHGLKAIAHLNAVSWTRAAELGIDGLEHALPTSPDLLEPSARAQYLAELGPNSKYMYRWFELADYDGPLIREMVNRVVQKKVALNLTLVVNEIVYNADDLTRAIPVHVRKYEHAETLDSMLTSLRISMTGWTPEDFSRARAVMPKVLQVARLLHEAGAKMMIGTDGHGGSPYYARELELHVQAGIPVWAVLRMATSGAADILGIGHRVGRIQAGYEADVVFLQADPVTDIGSAGKVYGVLDNGVLRLASELIESSSPIGRKN
jgi:imidazolonepropionase-like amidohydrolase